jgi:hypothetical protein
MLVAIQFRVSYLPAPFMKRITAMVDREAECFRSNKTLKTVTHGNNKKSTHERRGETSRPHQHRSVQTSQREQYHHTTEAEKTV